MNYKGMTSEDRKRLIESGFIESDSVPSKDRRYDLEWHYCGSIESICRNRTWIYCDTIQKRKECLRQYENGRFEKKRIK